MGGAALHLTQHAQRSRWMDGRTDGDEWHRRQTKIPGIHSPAQLQNCSGSSACLQAARRHPSPCRLVAVALIAHRLFSGHPPPLVLQPRSQACHSLTPLSLSSLSAILQVKMHQTLVQDSFLSREAQQRKFQITLVLKTKFRRSEKRGKRNTETELTI